MGINNNQRHNKNKNVINLFLSFFFYSSETVKKLSLPFDTIVVFIYARKFRLKQWKFTFFLFDRTIIYYERNNIGRYTDAQKSKIIIKKPNLFYISLPTKKKKLKVMPPSYVVCFSQISVDWFSHSITSINAHCRFCPTL